jgi:hypothetical protein
VLNPGDEETVSDAVAGGADAGSALSEKSGVVAAGGDGAGISAPLPGVPAVREDDVSCALLGVCCLLMRNLRHVSELRVRSAAVVATAGLASNDLVVSVSSCPVIGSPFRI